ncbi:zf-HC2 domain-containing protein [candidate division KSB1 bacterium]|nr:zf-HC2 domain-containing protein [candidate division KSB1 bacterium]
MKKNECKNMTCNEIQHVLIQGESNRLTPDELRLVEVHLAKCPDCKQFESFLLQMQGAIKIQANDAPVPEPENRRRLLGLLAFRQRRKPVITARLWQTIRAVIEYRIPVYQILLAATCIWFLIWAINISAAFFDSINGRSPGFARIERVDTGDIYVIEELSILEHQKIGRNAREDSTLTSLLVEM